MKIIENIDQLKKLSETYTSPCIHCETDDGCPSMAECKVYQEWKQKCRSLLRDSTEELLGNKSEEQ